LNGILGAMKVLAHGLPKPTPYFITRSGVIKMKLFECTSQLLDGGYTTGMIVIMAETIEEATIKAIAYLKLKGVCSSKQERITLEHDLKGLYEIPEGITFDYGSA
jgi:hypothetical protein